MPPFASLPCPRITIIIPTACSAQRADSLLRAIDSIHQASSGSTKIIVAANGPNIDAALAKQLAERPDLHYVFFEEGSSPKTLSIAMPLVETEFFGFLDDDDELLPNALMQRLSVLLSHPEAGLVVSNGYIRKSGEDIVCFRHMNKIRTDPLGALMLENWLPSCGGLYRTSSVGPLYFQDYHPYAEWSWLAFRLVLDNQKICVLDAPTFRINADTPSSLSKSAEYRQNYINLYRKMLGLQPPHRIRAILRKKLAQACHDASDQALNNGRIGESIRYHVLSLSGWHGLGFIPYTRHILFRGLRDLINNLSR